MYALKLLNIYALKLLNISTLKLLNISALKFLNISALKFLNISALKLLYISASTQHIGLKYVGFGLIPPFQNLVFIINVLVGKLSEMLEDKSTLMMRIERMEADLAAVNRYP